MRARDLVDLIALAALWGGSFLFLRVAAPLFGPFALIELRVAIAAATLLPLLALRGATAELWRRPGKLLVVGALNSALPFVLLAFATLSLTAGFASILNATTPLWTAVVAAVWLRDPIRPRQWIGLALGVVGVVVLVWGKVDLRLLSARAGDTSIAIAVAAALLATASYGVAANYAKRYLAGVPALAMATGSQLGATILLFPTAIAFWPAATPPLGAWLAVVALGVFCTALAYILYFRLITNTGALRAASVTFLIPVFATTWGAMFLDETLTLQMLAGGVTILLGTALSLGLIGKSVGRATVAEQR